jgi:endonuclease YncB( thermonuclease family)
VALPRSSFAICQYALNSAKSVSSALERSLLAVILAVAIGTVQGAQWIVEGRVVGLSDGDTITVLDTDKRQHKIRINGIDALRKGKRSASDRARAWLR